MQGKSQREKEFAVGQLIASAISDASIIDVLSAAGLERLEISVLSDEFLSEIKGMKQKNLPLVSLYGVDELRQSLRFECKNVSPIGPDLRPTLTPRYHD